MIDKISGLEDIAAKKRKWRKAFLTLGFSISGGLLRYSKDVKDSAEQHVPDYTEEYLVNGEKVSVGYYDPNKDHSPIRFFWRLIYAVLFLAIQIVIIMPVALILWIFYAIKEKKQLNNTMYEQISSFDTVDNRSNDDNF